MSLRDLFLVGVSSTVISCCGGAAEAADVRLVNHDLKAFEEDRIECDVRLSGAIQDGDASKLNAALAKRSGGTFGAVLCLDSPGGAYREGLKIAASLIREGVSTAVDADAHCYSACAIIFMAGTSIGESSQQPMRRLHVLGTLGFHAPYLTVKTGNFGSDVLNAAYREGVVAIGQLLKLEPRRPPVDYFPKELLAELTQYGPNEVYDIDTIGKAIRFNVDLVGLPVQRQLKDYSVSQLCAACDNFEWNVAQIGQCKPETLQKALDKKSSRTTFSFLNYGGEEGGLRCEISANFGVPASGGGEIYWTIEERSVAPKFFYGENTLLRSFAKSTGKTR